MFVHLGMPDFFSSFFVGCTGYKTPCDGVWDEV